jgi:hypothetical protein
MEAQKITLYRLPNTTDEVPFMSVCEYIDEKDHSTFYVQTSQTTKPEWIKLGDLANRAYKKGLLEISEEWI